MPGNIRNEIGHFNVFRLDPFVGDQAKPVPYKRRDVYRGVSAYFCHNSYVAQVLDLTMQNGRPRVQKVCCAIDCGIVINPDAAINMAEGAIVDGIGNAFKAP